MDSDLIRHEIERTAERLADDLRLLDERAARAARHAAAWAAAAVATVGALAAVAVWYRARTRRRTRQIVRWPGASTLAR